jgi:hypothetical protein
MHAQGFKHQLDQYKFGNAISDCAANPVWVAEHRISGLKVAIKAVLTKKYKRLQKENRISEADAMKFCQSSPFVTTLIE